MSLFDKIIQWVNKVFNKPKSRSVYRRKVRKKIIQNISKKNTRGSQVKGAVKIKQNGGRSKPSKKVGGGSSRQVVVASVSRKKIQKDRQSESKPLGEVTHYFGKIKVCVVRIDFGILRKGDQVLISGKDSSLIQTVNSLQIENEDVLSAQKGQLVGLKVKEPVGVGSKVSHVKAK